MKSIKVLTLFAAIAIAFSGCGILSDSNEELEESVPVTSDDVDVSEDVVKRTIKASEFSEELLGWSELSRYTGDVDGDGANENVVLVTSASRENGKLSYNDGQKWAVYVDGKDNDFVLFEQYVNIGDVYFEVVECYMADGAIPQINVICSSTAGFYVNSYTFSKTEDVYLERTLFDLTDGTEAGINRHYTSIPGYN